MKTETTEIFRGIPGPRSGLSGSYQVKVIEPVGLALLRLSAARLANLETKIGRGTVDDYLKLDHADRAALDDELALIVIASRDRLQNWPHLTVHERPETPNLVLDQGMNYVATTWYAQMGLACAVGNGTTPTYRDSGAITVTIATGTATASAPFFAPGDVGYLLKADSGEETYVTGYTSDVIVSIAPGVAVAGQPFTLWYVNQVGLDSEVQRTVTYLTGAGNTGSSRVGAVCTWQWTYDGVTEIANQVYSELGISPSGTPGNNLFSRFLIIGGSVTVLIGQKIRVVYKLNVTVAPTTPQLKTSTVVGWPVAPSVNQDGEYQIVGWNTPDVYAFAFAGLTTTGNTNIGYNNDFDVAVNPGGGELGTNTIMPGFLGGSPPTNGVFTTSHSLLPYVSGSFHRAKRFVWDLSAANRTDWRVFVVDGAIARPWWWLWAQNQTKDSSHTLTLDVMFTWTRTLVNP